MSFFTEKNEMPKNPIFTPPCGPVKGHFRRDVSGFKGIPYALPPVGENRFKAPKPFPPWTETRECLKHGYASLQMGGITLDAASTYHMEGKSEDCLFLNVWTPATSPNDALPVYVFIHGGAFSSGSGSELIYDGGRMASGGVVVVTINYRLGALGFLATRGLLEESGMTGNYGLLDQIQALKWVQENISAFGGDPKKVTIGGQSAGAYSVTALLLSPLAKGLFHQAIVESGSIFSISAFSVLNRGNLFRSLDNGRLFCELFGIEDSIDGLDQLRALPGDVFAAMSMVKSDRSTVPTAFSFWPVYDGIVLPENPVAALKQGEINPAKILLGYNSDESSLFIKNHTNLGIYQMLCYQIFGPQKAPEVMNYFFIDEEHSPLKRTEEVYTYSAFLIGMVLMAKKYSQLGHDVYFYNFDYDPAILKIVGLNTAHGMELPFVFGNGIGQRRATKISNLSWIMQQSWVNFIKSGNPNFNVEYKGQIIWPKFDPINQYIMVFDAHLSSRCLPNHQDLDFLEKIMFE